ncbi:DUF4440 domain-containing protein, partial [Corynebacterium bovis]
APAGVPVSADDAGAASAPGTGPAPGRVTGSFTRASGAPPGMPPPEVKEKPPLAS